MSTEANQSPKEAAEGEVTASFTLSGPDWKLQASLTVSRQPMRLSELLPVLHEFCNGVVNAAEQSVREAGLTVSCKAGCGACCRQLVPISETEARQLARLVADLPEPRQSEIRQRFAEAKQRLQANGMWETLAARATWDEAAGIQAVGLEYFHLGIPCPFLEAESCSIHPDRPLTCREYLVTSPAEHCQQPSAQVIQQVPIPLKTWTALARMTPAEAESKFIRWVPLVMSLDFAAEYPEEPPAQPGPQLLREFIEIAVGKRGQIPEPPLGAGSRSE